tara:strand:- start:15674 stop:16162 length:489 start_codon:yes stop_codon:yes gene_type:complete
VLLNVSFAIAVYTPAGSQPLSQEDVDAWREQVDESEGLLIDLNTASARESALAHLRVSLRTTLERSGVAVTVVTERDPLERALGALRLGYGRGLMLSRRRSRNTSVETARRSESLRMADHSTFESGRLSGVGASWQRGPSHEERGMPVSTMVSQPPRGRAST